MGVYCLMIALGLTTMMSCSGVSGSSSGQPANGTGSGSGTNNGSSSSGKSQYLYTANESSGTISCFAVKGDGTLSPLANFPVAAASPAVTASAANNSLLLGG